MPHIPKAICVPCAIEYRTKKIGYEILMKTEGQPYYQITADLFECPKCGHQIATGFAFNPYWQNYMKGEATPSPDLIATFKDEN